MGPMVNARWVTLLAVVRGCGSHRARRDSDLDGDTSGVMG